MLSLDDLKKQKIIKIIQNTKIAYSQYIQPNLQNSSFENFKNNENISLKEFFNYIIKTDEIQELKKSDFSKIIYEDFFNSFKTIIKEYNKNNMPNTNNLIISIKKQMKIGISEAEKIERKNDLISDIKNILKSYYENKIKLDDLDENLENLIKSISVINKNQNTINKSVIDKILKMNQKQKLHKNPEIQKLATELEEHLKPKDKITPPGLNNQPTSPEMS